MSCNFCFLLRVAWKSSQQAVLKSNCGTLIEELAWPWKSSRDFSCPYFQHRFCCAASCPFNHDIVLRSQNDQTFTLSYKTLSFYSVVVLMLNFLLSLVLKNSESRTFFPGIPLALSVDASSMIIWIRRNHSVCTLSTLLIFYSLWGL